MHRNRDTMRENGVAVIQKWSSNAENGVIRKNGALKMKNVSVMHRNGEKMRDPVADPVGSGSYRYFGYVKLYKKGIFY